MIQIYLILHQIINSSYWNKRDLNQLLPQNNKDLKGHLERFKSVFISTKRVLTNWVLYYTQVNNIEAASSLGVIQSLNN